MDLSTDLSVDILISVFLDLRLVQQMTKRNVFLGSATRQQYKGEFQKPT
jgi:hypothetical protein